MAVIAFYYLLRVGEYTYAAAKTKKLTTAFRVRDVTLWNNTIILDHSLPIETYYCVVPQQHSEFQTRKTANVTRQYITKQLLHPLAQLEH